MRHGKHIGWLTVLWLGLCGCGRETLFESLPSSQTGIDFVNRVEENDKYNVLAYMNIYTGAGVAAGDVNNDGLTDLFFSGNQTSSRLYLNEGALKFQDVTKASGLTTDRWCTGVSMVDINQDGWLDIYVNVSGSTTFGNRANLLYVNNGIAKSGKQKGRVTFTERAAEYGLAETRQTMNASFFDYDRDGDLDCFLITNPADQMMTGVNNVAARKVNGESEGTDILYRNDGKGHFEDVSKQAGILIEGYSLGAAISDMNGDGWPDIYVSNDFLTNDILYINNQNGTFTDRAGEYLKHTSFASMGNDVADMNNDGLPDIFVLDMLPEDNLRRKMLIPAASYDKFQLAVQRGYQPQYTRNTLQLNNGNSTFSDVGFLAGVSSTDWSWSALWGDYDNDGDKDLMVTNGFYRDLGNLDYITYQAKSQSPMGSANAKRAEKLAAIHSLDKVPLQNYLYENNNANQPGNLTFTKRSDDWGFTDKGFSNGAVYADLDNDGDLELVINRFNDKAQVFRNWSRERTKRHFLSVRLNGPPTNRQGTGTKLWLYTDNSIRGQSDREKPVQFQENNPYRGYESSVDPIVHFGLGTVTRIDSVVVEWPDGHRQTLRNVRPDQRFVIRYADARQPPAWPPANAPARLFTDVTGQRGLTYTHQENTFEDFTVQPLLPHMHSRNGPGVAVGDVNGDGRADVYVGGAAGVGGRFFLQTATGSFQQRALPQPSAVDEMGVLLFDADGDRDLDLYIVGGGSEQLDGSSLYQHRFFVNDGAGNFSHRPTALPTIRSSGSCVVAGDYDADGDLDLFVGGRVSPGRYPMPSRSYLLRNDSPPASKGGVTDARVTPPLEAGGLWHFTDVTGRVCPELVQPGMVTSALWTDFDNDNRPDLIVTGEFMPIRFFKNTANHLREITGETGLTHTVGWWNSLAAGDFDEDGDMDYVAGNLGLNSRYRATPSEPLCIFAKDYDKNGTIDPVMCYFVQGQNYPSHTRTDLIKQINPMRGRFNTFLDYATARFEDSFLPSELADAYVVRSDCFESSYIENKGNGRFVRRALPTDAQLGPVYGLLPSDYNGDGHPDILLTGNSYVTEVSTGRYDALTGLLLLGDGTGRLTPSRSAKTGFQADGDAKGLTELFLTTGERIILVANNNSRLESYALTTGTHQVVPLQPDDVYALVHKQNGKTYRQEFYYGQGYLSQTARGLMLGQNETAVIYNRYGQKRFP